MRKFTILFLIFAFSMMSFITGCSDDENGGTTDPSIDPEDYDYYMLVSATGNQRSDFLLGRIKGLCLVQYQYPCLSR